MQLPCTDGAAPRTPARSAAGRAAGAGGRTGWQQATRANVQPNPNAMVLATADAARRTVGARRAVQGDPARCRLFTFFSNYLSRKGAELSANPRAAAVMYWDVLRRQVRLEGRVTPTTAAESDAYFASRAWQSRIGAWASQQSAPIASRAELDARHRAARRGASACPRRPPATMLAPDPGVAIPRPPHWGGYHLWVEAVELWVEGVGAPARSGALDAHARACGRRLHAAGRGAPRACSLSSILRSHGHRRLQQARDATARAAAACGLWIVAGDRTLVQDLSFDLQRGEFLAILGRNGSGKSLTLHALAGLSAPPARPHAARRRGYALPCRAARSHAAWDCCCRIAKNRWR